MTAVVTAATVTTAPPRRLDFVLPPELEADEPPEVRGRGRDDVRLLVSIGEREPIHTRFDQLAEHLDAGDLLVVNTSGTLPASIHATTPSGSTIEVHLSTELPTGLWLVELRTPAEPASRPDPSDHAGETLTLPGGGRIEVLARFHGSHRLWLATIHHAEPTIADYLRQHGRPIRYRHVTHDWPVSAYQTVFADELGSAEMPSASRPFTAELVTRLVAKGVDLARVVLHTGVSSLEGDELPYPERFRIDAATAARVNETRRRGGRIVAGGTTVVRALESAVTADGTVVARDGWTDVVVSPEHGVRVVDGLLTGWHEPEATHLWMLEAIAGRPALDRAYRAALAEGYEWHEFGDTHLILPEPLGSRPERSAVLSPPRAD
jgi:S-adenosylmethionine:tRNA ribosyltransferase-isomerase